MLSLGLRVLLFASLVGSLLPCARAVGTGDRRTAREFGHLADSVLTRYAMYGFSGSVLLEENGRVVLEKGYGLADRERAVPATASTRYDIGSIAKTFAAAAILQLADAGRLKLTDSLSRFFIGVTPDKAGVTIHHLLTHTSGLPLDPAEAGILENDSPAAFIAKAMSFPVKPATIGAYSYSNLGYGLVALIVEAVSGQSFQVYVATHLMGPAGLTRTMWWRDTNAVSIPGTARGYVFSDRENVLSPEPAFSRGGPGTPMWSKWPLGAGGMVSTVGDLRLWWKALNKSGVLSEAASHAMLSRRDTAGNQGYSWTVAPRGNLGLRIYKGGSRTGFTSMISSYPERNALIVFALNQSAESQWAPMIWSRLETLLAGDTVALPPPVTTIGEKGLGRFAGLYRIATGGDVRVIAEGGELLVGAEGQAAAEALNGTSLPKASRYAALTLQIIEQRASDTTLIDARQRRDILQWLTAHSPAGGPLGALVLGTTPHPSGGGRMQTFLRVGAFGSPVIRLIWQGERVVGWSDGIRLPAFRRYKPTSTSTAVSFSPRERDWQVLRLDASGETLQIQSTNGTSTALARRVRTPRE